MTTQGYVLVPREAIDRLTSIIDRLIRQAESDLESAHAEICNLQNLDPATHTWPEWTPQANSLRWFNDIREQVKTACPSHYDDLLKAMEECEAAARKLDKFAWSAVTADCAEAREYLQSLIDNNRAALSRLTSLREKA